MRPQSSCIAGAVFSGSPGGSWTGQVVAASQLPAKTDTMDGVAWFPRLVAKARAKLAGELDEPYHVWMRDRSFSRRLWHTLDSFLKSSGSTVRMMSYP